MVQKPWKIFVTSALLASSSAALALPFNSFDPRSMAMGGAGVAVGDAGMAPFFNPALLTVTREEDDFSLDLPIIGARVYDPSDFANSLDNFQNGNYVDTLQTSIDTYNAAGGQTTVNLNAVAANTSTLSTQFATLSDKPIQAELGAGLVVGIPSKSFGGAFYANGWAAVGGVIKYRDNQTLQDFATASSTIATTVNTSCGGTVNNNPTCLTALSTLSTDPLVQQYFVVNTTGTPTVTANFNTTGTGTNTLKSTVDIRGVGLAEVGLALSHEFGTGDAAWGLGITPKVVKVNLYEYSASVNSGSTSNATGSDYTAKYSHVNFDLGLARNYGNGWRAGLVVKNVIPHTYEFKNAPTPGATPVPTGNTIKLKPQARIGASHSTSWSTVAMDLDLTTNDPAGLENQSQYLALGAELNAWDWAQLRLGYRANLKDSTRNVPSIGLGLAPFGVLHLDVGVAKSANEIGASARLAFTF
ncbi:MAG: conjugal transfer protein TraF [Gallionella sp.]|nr:conjugal transfer protein TraF [Gallionella sp.]